MIGSWLRGKVTDRFRSSFSVGVIFEQVIAHVSALSQLFAEECKEYVRHQAARVILFLVGLVFLALSYIAFWVTVVVLLSIWMPLVYAAAICFGVHFFGGLILVLCGVKMKGKPFAVATRQELQHDLTCARLTLNKKKI